MKILLAIDGSKYSDAAVREVARRVLDDISQVRIVTVIKPVMTPSPEHLQEPAKFYEKAEQAEERCAFEIVERAVSALRAGQNREVRISTEIVTGQPAETILDEAEKFDADLIVVGSHGQSSWEWMLLGSVSLAVAQYAKCSVLIVRIPQADV